MIKKLCFVTLGFIPKLFIVLSFHSSLLGSWNNTSMSESIFCPSILPLNEKTLLKKYIFA